MKTVFFGGVGYVAFNNTTSDYVFQRHVTSAGCRVFPSRWRTLSLTLYVTLSRQRATSCRRLNSTTWWVLAVRNITRTKTNRKPWLYLLSETSSKSLTCETSRKSPGSPSSKTEIEVKVVNLTGRSTVQLKIRSCKLSILGVCVGVGGSETHILVAVIVLYCTGSRHKNNE